MKRRYVWIIAVLLMVVSLACAGFGRSRRDQGGAEVTAVVKQEVTVTVQEEDADEDEPTPVPEPTSTPVPTATPAPVEEEPGDVAFPEVDPGSMDALQSYRSDMTLQITSEEDTTGRLSVKHEVDRGASAQHILMQVEGMEDFDVDVGELGGSFEIEVIQVAGQLWVRMGESWMQTPSQDDDPADELADIFDVAELLDDIEDTAYEYKGREVVNGVNTRHFQFQTESLSRLLDFGEMEISQEGTVDVWIADESDLPTFATRMTMESEGEVEGKQSQTTFKLDVYDVNDPSITIEPPEDMGGAAWPEDVPEYANAQDVSLMEGLVVFFTDDDVETVAEFYREELELAGWEQQDAFEADAVVETWTKEDRTLNLMINVDEDRGVTQVAITVE